MNTYNTDILKDAHKHSIFHKSEIDKSIICGCFYCMETFSPNEILEWTDEDDPRGETALCPKCGIDSVLGSESNFPVNEKSFLTAMNKFYF